MLFAAVMPPHDAFPEDELQIIPLHAGFVHQMQVNRRYQPPRPFLPLYYLSCKKRGKLLTRFRLACQFFSNPAHLRVYGVARDTKQTSRRFLRPRHRKCGNDSLLPRREASQ